MPSTAAETFYDLAVRALEEHERQVSSLRARTGTLVAAAAVAAGLLGREVFADTHPDGIMEWAAAASGLLALAAMLAASVFLLRSHELSFSLDGAAAYEEAQDFGALNQVDAAEAVHTGVTYGLAGVQAGNGPTVVRLKTAFAFALGGLVIEVLGLGLAAALA